MSKTPFDSVARWRPRTVQRGEAPLCAVPVLTAAPFPSVTIAVNGECHTSRLLTQVLPPLWTFPENSIISIESISVCVLVYKSPSAPFFP